MRLYFAYSIRAVCRVSFHSVCAVGLCSVVKSQMFRGRYTLQLHNTHELIESAITVVDVFRSA